MLFHRLPYRFNFAILTAIVERRNVGRRRGRRRCQNVGEQPHAAENYRRSDGIGREGENAALAQEPSAAVIPQRHASKSTAVNVWDSVVMRKPFVEEGVVRIQ